MCYFFVENLKTSCNILAPQKSEFQQSFYYLKKKKKQICQLQKCDCCYSMFCTVCSSVIHLVCNFPVEAESHPLACLCRTHHSTRATAQRDTHQQRPLQICLLVKNSESAWHPRQLTQLLEKILVAQGKRSLFNALLSSTMLINVALYINDVSSKRKQI